MAPKCHGRHGNYIIGYDASAQTSFLQIMGQGKGPEVKSMSLVGACINGLLQLEAGQGLLIWGDYVGSWHESVPYVSLQAGFLALMQDTRPLWVQTWSSPVGTVRVHGATYTDETIYIAGTVYSQGHIKVGTGLNVHVTAGLCGLISRVTMKGQVLDTKASSTVSVYTDVMPVDSPNDVGLTVALAGHKFLYECDESDESETIHHSIIQVFDSDLNTIATHTYEGLDQRLCARYGLINTKGGQTKVLLLPDFTEVTILPVAVQGHKVSLDRKGAYILGTDLSVWYLSMGTSIQTLQSAEDEERFYLQDHETERVGIVKQITPRQRRTGTARIYAKPI